jgi:hypothetical protein
MGRDRTKYRGLASGVQLYHAFHCPEHKRLQIQAKMKGIHYLSVDDTAFSA